MQNASGLLLPILDVLASNIIDVSGFSYAAATIIFKTHTHTLSLTHTLFLSLSLSLFLSHSLSLYTHTQICQSQANKHSNYPIRIKKHLTAKILFKKFLLPAQIN
jgi:hypothetical protein